MKEIKKKSGEDEGDGERERPSYCFDGMTKGLSMYTYMYIYI